MGRSRQRACNERPRRRGTVLFAVLFLIAIASLSAAAMLTATAAERRAAVYSVDDLELRLAVRSALAVVTADLAGQREDLLAGESPDTPDSVRIARGEPDRDDNPPGIVVEFVGVVGGVSGGGSLTSEAGRLDVNSAPLEALAALPGIPEGLALAIDQRRKSRLFGSVAELDALSAQSGAGASGGSEFDESASELAGPSGTAPAGSAPLPSSSDDTGDWRDLLTVFAADPVVSMGVADPDRLGGTRVNINAPWSDRLEDALAEAAGEAMDESVRTLFIDAPRLTAPSVLVELLADKGVDPTLWGPLLDAVTTTPDQFRLGLVDVNRAPRAVLAALPGLDDQAAAGIINARERLDADRKMSIAWPLTEGVIDETAFRACVDRLTTRSMQWRFTLRASFEDESGTAIGFGPDDPLPDLVGEADEFGVMIEDEEDADAGPSLLFEVVIDLAGDRPRIAYLREITAYEFAVAVRSVPGFGGSTQSEDDEALFGAGDPDGLTPEGDDEGFGFGEPVNLEDLMNEAIDEEADGFGTGSDLGPDSGLDGGLATDPIGDADEDGAVPWDGDLTDEDPFGIDGADDDSARRSGPSGSGSSGSGGTGGGGRDNRLGRWAPARGGLASGSAGAGGTR